MRRTFFTLIPIACSFAAAAALAGTVYKWVDENGVVHYSDQPHPNAQKIQLRDVQTYKESGMTSAASTAPPAPVSTAPSGYRGCAVVSPQADESFANLDSLTVVVQTDPALHPGDQIFVTYDGQPLNGNAATGGQFTISPVDRGTHTLQAVVRDSTGNVLCSAPGISFNVHQPSVQSPTNPIRPH
jgi:Domain of unknown function (DUF4124)